MYIVLFVLLLSWYEFSGESCFPVSAKCARTIRRHANPPVDGNWKRGQMPSFASFSDLEKRAVIAFLLGEGKDEQIETKDLNSELRRKCSCSNDRPSRLA
jgi:hypothetical protein